MEFLKEIESINYVKNKHKYYGIFKRNREYQLCQKLKI